LYWRGSRVLSLQPIDVVLTHIPVARFGRNLNNHVSKSKYNHIVVTGCSLSTGMEMNEHLLPEIKNRQHKRMLIFEWAQENSLIKGDNFNSDMDKAQMFWEQEEKTKSWPTLLEKQTGISVSNLSQIGASVDYSLLALKKWIRNNKNNKNKTCVIHQIPNLGRIYMKFNEEIGRINVQPMDIQDNRKFGFKKKYYRKEIENIHKTYKKFCTKNKYFENRFEKILKRLHKIALDNNMDDYYIFQNEDQMPEHLRDKTIMFNFKQFRSKYKVGSDGHPIDEKYNLDICKICEPIFS